MDKEIKRVTGKLNNAGFLAKAPADVVEKEKAKAEELIYTYTYQESKTKFAVVHSLDGYDEISLTNEFKVATSDNEKVYTPESLGFSRYRAVSYTHLDVYKRQHILFHDMYKCVRQSTSHVMRR